MDNKYLYFGLDNSVTFVDLSEIRKVVFEIKLNDFTAYPAEGCKVN